MQYSDLLDIINTGIFHGEKVFLDKSVYNISSDLNLFAYQASLNLDDTKVKGFGSDFSEQAALIKAIVELIERASFLGISGASSSSGLAAHTDFSQAAKNAAFELIERDLFLCHYLTSVPMLDQTSDAGSISHEFSTARTVLLTDGFDLRIGLMHKSENLSAYFCVLFDEQRGGCIVGSACKDDQKSAINKALCEVLVNFCFMRAEKITPLSVDCFYGLPDPTLMDHFKLGLTREAGQKFRNLLTNNGVFGVDESVFFHSMEVELVQIHRAFSELALSVCYAKNTELQPMFFGRTTESKVNFNRLARFAGRPLAFSDLERIPHPFN